MKTTMILTVLSLAVSLPGFSQSTPSTLVKVDGGLVEGTLEDGITIYRGIPFVAPPAL